MSSSAPNEVYPMTDEDKERAKKSKAYAKKKTTAYMKGVKEYLKERNGGKLEQVWDLDMDMLESYYYQYTFICREIEELPSLIVNTRYGPQPVQLLGARDKAAMRLESLQKSMGLSLKAGKAMNMVEPVREESAVEEFLRGKINKEEK